MYCNNCGALISDNTKVCPSCNNPIVNLTGSQDDDKLNICFGCIGFIQPIIGIVLWCIFKNEHPKWAKILKYSTITGSILYILIWIIYFIFCLIRNMALYGVL